MYCISSGLLPALFPIAPALQWLLVSNSATWLGCVTAMNLYPMGADGEMPKGSWLQQRFVVLVLMTMMDDSPGGCLCFVELPILFNWA